MDKNSLYLCEAMDKLGFGDVIPADDDRTVLTVQSDGVTQDNEMDGNFDVSVGVSSNTSADDLRRLSIERCNPWIRSLFHASDCRHADCALPLCFKMKRIIHHAKGCKRRSIKLSVSGDNSGQTTGANCLVCKQLIEMCFYHAKYCRHNKCPVLYCANIKLKLRQRLLKQRLREAITLKRRIASMASVAQYCSQQTSTDTTTPSTATPRTSAQIEAIVAQVNSLSLHLRQ